MKESSYYQKLGIYYLHNTTHEAIEVKITKTNRLPFSSVPDHQEHALAQPWYYKIPDVGRAKKPLDIVFKRNHAPLVVVYYKPRGTTIVEIPIRTFLAEKYCSQEKSLTLARACEIGTIIHI